MNGLATAPQTTSTVEYKGADTPVALQTGLLLDSVFGTNAGVRRIHRWDETAGFVTTAPASKRVTRLLGLHEEVRDLRDRICALGLTRQDIARAIGVDRRSLSGWVSGEIRPAAERVELLGVLMQLVIDIDAERPGRARDVMIARQSGRALLDRIATESGSILDAWRASIRPEAAVTVTRRRPPSGQPLWAAAARALAEGRLTAPTSERKVRPAATYEVEPADAAAFEEAEPERSRRGYR